MDWKTEAQDVMDDFVYKTNGSCIKVTGNDDDICMFMYILCF